MQDLNSSIALLEKKYGREPGSVRVLAVSKGQPIEKILALYQTGQRAFGENYLQEAFKKIPVLPKDIEWHFIGPIQSNKTRKIAECFHWVQSIDQIKIAERLHAQRPLHLPPLNVCIQVNISHETTKSGISIKNILPLAHACSTFSQLRLRGLMAIPAPTMNREQQRHVFKQLRLLYEDLCRQGFMLDTLSMGMSEDYEAAIAEGATFIRLGRALFGERV